MQTSPTINLRLPLALLIDALTAEGYTVSPPGITLPPAADEPLVGAPRQLVGHTSAGHDVVDCVIDGIPRRLQVVGHDPDQFLVRGGNFKFTSLPGVTPVALPGTDHEGTRIPDDFRKPASCRWRQFERDKAFYLEQSEGPDEAVPDWLGDTPQAAAGAGLDPVNIILTVE